MLDLFDELTQLVAALDEQRVGYALCGGLAMAVWGFPRATVDIDLLIQSVDLWAAEAVAEARGYRIKARPMSFSSGAIVIHRVSKIDPDGGDVLMLDLMIVTPPIADVWNGREQLDWQGGKISVVSREGLIKLKRFRSSGTDLDDIERLQEAQ
ncbi:MAG TPA: nucleotidyl transferase AbiEii/AbiGii toxin family protein [Thermoanaerobaculia bacterium]|nr:nucleotidyl transferase AbiEii/AbiGii toxin family protein [Thermoanaerobaculia bacterium]